MRNNKEEETQLADEALASIEALLPANWRITRQDIVPLKSPRYDAIIALSAPNGVAIPFVVETKRSGSLPNAQILTGLREISRVTPLPVLLLSDYLGPSLRASLATEGISYSDATGWVRVTSDDPLILLTGQGALKSPKPVRASAIVRLNGVAASRTIRALSTASLPIGVRELAELSGVSPGSVSKLLATLASEGIVDRDARGGVLAVRLRALIQRWARDYAFAKTNKNVNYYIAPRGLDRTIARLQVATTPVALTGSAAARRLLPQGTTSVVPLKLLSLYSNATRELTRELGLIDAAPQDANVVIATPQDQKILPQPDQTPSSAPPALVVADLLTLPNRSDAEAEQLMDVLGRVNDAWRE